MKAKELRRDNGNCARTAVPLESRRRVRRKIGGRGFYGSPTGGDKLDFLVFADSQDEDNNGLWWKCAWKDAIGHFPGTRLFRARGRYSPVFRQP